MTTSNLSQFPKTSYHKCILCISEQINCLWNPTNIHTHFSSFPPVRIEVVYTPPSKLYHTQLSCACGCTFSQLFIVPVFQPLFYTKLFPSISTYSGFLASFIFGKFFLLTLPASVSPNCLALSTNFSKKWSILTVQFICHSSSNQIQSSSTLITTIILLKISLLSKLLFHEI